MKLSFRNYDSEDPRWKKRCGCEVGYHCCCNEAGGSPDDLVNKMHRNEVFFNIGSPWWENGVEEVDD